MKVAIGPKGRQTMFRLIFGYRGHGKRWGKINFGNGFTLRAGSVGLHVWQPRGHALTSTDDALGYATRLAVALWSKHWKHDMPQWTPLPDLMGVLTQIDNMTAGMKRFQPVCQTCGKTPQNVGWCDKCGYNRNYKDEPVAAASEH